jgi:hypothetical protein
MMGEPEYAMLSAINAARVERGLHALAANAPLATAAERHAQDMAAASGHCPHWQRRLDHRRAYQGRGLCAGGVWGSGRLGMARVKSPRRWNGGSTPPRIVGYVLSPEYTEIGVGYATGLGPWGHYWAVDFGRPATVAPRLRLPRPARTRRMCLSSLAAPLRPVSTC